MLEGLTELEQEVLRLHYDDDLDFQEIAARLGKEPNAVHQIHYRALTKLRRRGGVNEVTLELLFDEFATSYLRGERRTCATTSSEPATSEDELGGPLDRFLQAVPARESTEEEIVLVQARARAASRRCSSFDVGRRLTRESVVSALVTALRLDRGEGRQGRRLLPRPRGRNPRPGAASTGVSGTCSPTC